MNYRPKLREIHVPLQKLLLDPNNPRFLEDHDDRVAEANYADSGVQRTTATRMNKEGYKLEELKKSILTNGWQPVDRIFVRKLAELPGQYVVLEGNRRLMALWEVRDKLDKDVLKQVDPLRVLEVVGTDDEEESRAQIAYLLGVRHHGSLKKWRPFAQAHNLYERYLQLGKMTHKSFHWDERIAALIGDRLGVEVNDIQERLRVYRAMQQLHEVPAINKIGMEGKYYSLVESALPQSKSALRDYIRQDSSTFLLDDESLRRMDAVCHFSAKERAGAPVKNPAEWRPLTKILEDSDLARRAEMLDEVEKGKKPPSEVSARRQAELRHPRWDRWLNEVAELLRRLQIVNLDSEDERAKKVTTRLAKVLDALAPPPAGTAGRKEAGH
jgi:hypothetical protein